MKETRYNTVDAVKEKVSETTNMLSDNLKHYCVECSDLWKIWMDQFSYCGKSILKRIMLKLRRSKKKECNSPN